ncbi:MAG: hypothetical protein OYH77_05980 [Pseudomonadota bacterium]|nr:hypothetical protein [Pseudomonadota bacterium]
MKAVGIILLSVMLASPALGFFNFASRSANKLNKLRLFARTFRVMQIENYQAVKAMDMDQFKAIKDLDEIADIDQLNAALKLQLDVDYTELREDQIIAIQKLSVDQFKAIQRLANE